METQSSTLTAPVIPDDYSIQGGHLHLHGFDLAALATYWLDHAAQDDAPLTIRYLPIIRAKLDKAREAFAQATRETGYEGEIRLAYASKANPNEAVIHAAIGSGADYECSSRADASIIRYAIERGWLTAQQRVFANGFKTSSYADALIALATEGFSGITPIFDAPCEIKYFADSGVQFNVGLRFRVPGRGERFGMSEAEMFEAAQLIANAPNLTLTTFHALQHYPAIGNPEHLTSLRNAFEVFKRLREQHPALAWFDVGGGIPIELSDHDDLKNYMASVQNVIVGCCQGSPVPGMIIESGRYLAGSHELKVYRVDRVKVVDGLSYYLLGGGIMSNLPDAWALGVEFPVVALNHLESAASGVRLAGLTCDPDDVYPSTKSGKLVTLPTQTDGLLVAFLDIGAYQDMLGGEGGAKHCLLSEGATILIGDDPDQPTRVTYKPAQSTDSVLHLLGYSQEHFSAF